jgi:GDP-mannose transporter
MSLQIVSSLIAASSNLYAYFFPPDALPGIELGPVETSSGLGYLWVVINCLVSAAYVRLSLKAIFSSSFSNLTSLARSLSTQILGMRKKIKSMGFTDWQTSFYNNAISIPVLLVASMLIEGWSSATFNKNLYVAFDAARVDSQRLLPFPAPTTRGLSSCWR